MRISALAKLGLIASLVAAAFVVAPSAFAAPIACGSVISTSGHYVLHKSIWHCAAAKAIEINADNVVLDLNGKTVDGDALGCSPCQVGVFVDPHSGVVVKNGTVRQFWNGVVFNNVSNGRILSLTGVGNRHGLRLDSGANGNLIKSNTITGGDNGITMDAAINNTITKNHLSAGNSSGIYLYGGSGNTITQNTMSGYGHEGIHALGSTTGNTIANNKALNNDVDGIQLDSTTTANHVTNNAANNNGADGVNAQPAADPSTVISGNTAKNNVALGIDGAGVTDGGGNTATGNGNAHECTSNFSCFVP